MKRMFYLSLALMLAVSFVLAAVNVTGEWDLTRKTPQGDRTSPITFTQDGEKLTVKMTGRNGEEITGTGTVKGNDIEWSITRTIRQLSCGPSGNRRWRLSSNCVWSRLR